MLGVLFGVSWHISVGRFGRRNGIVVPAQNLNPVVGPGALEINKRIAEFRLAAVLTGAFPARGPQGARARGGSGAGGGGGVATRVYVVGTIVAVGGGGRRQRARGRGRVVGRGQRNGVAVVVRAAEERVALRAVGREERGHVVLEKGPQGGHAGADNGCRQL